MRRSRAVLAVLAFAAMTGCGDASGWAGSIETLPNGTVRVTNPATETWTAADHWRLEPVLSIGRVEGEGPDVFSGIADIAVGRNGRIYVLDRQTNELRIFDATGAHVRTVGRKGGGPGEFTNAIGLVWLPGDSLLVADGQGARYTIFDRDGNVARTLRRPITSYGWVFQGGFANGLLYEEGFRHVGEESVPVLVAMRLGERAELVDTMPFPELDAEPIGYYSVQTDRGSMSMEIPFAPASAWQLMDDGSLWWGYGSAYRIYHLSADGDTLREIVNAATPIPVTQAEIDAFANGEGARQFREMGGNLDLDRIPELKPFFTRLYVDPSGRLWVDVPTVDGMTAFDVFDAEGRLLGRLETGVKCDQYIAPIVRDDRLYIVTVGELGVERVQEFRIVTSPADPLP